MTNKLNPDVEKRFDEMFGKKEDYGGEIVPRFLHHIKFFLASAINEALENQRSEMEERINVLPKKEETTRYTASHLGETGIRFDYMVSLQKVIFAIKNE